MSQNAYYPAGVTDAHIDALWGDQYSSDEIVELENERAGILRRLDELEKKEVYLKELTEAEEEEYSQLEDRSAALAVEIERLSDYDPEEDAKWQRADAMINERLGK